MPDSLIPVIVAALLGALLSAAIIIPVVRRTLNRSEHNRIRQQEPLARSVNAVLKMAADVNQNNETRISQMSDRLNVRIEDLNRSNQHQLEMMRRVVDEQLHTTLESRIGKSFELVNRQLENVHKGLGEMQALAGSIGDLKKVLQGVKTRGIWGEAQLGALLSQMLAPGQYCENIAVRPNTQERVEFALKLPGSGGDGMFMPIDSKFPLDAYTRLIDASETGNPIAVDQARRELSKSIAEQGKKISEKYICPPYTTDFALMFLPIESLYSEVLRLPGIVETLQLKHRVVLAGPATLAALLSSLQMGFTSYAIEQKSGEVLALLSSVKIDFSKFATMLDSTQKRLEQALSDLGAASGAARQITRKLDGLERLE